MKLSYKPESFCREYVNIKGDSHQLIQFMATVLGIKRAYDDWFPLRQIDKIEDMCRDYKLNYKFDWIFAPCEDVSKVISGGERLPTTKMFGFPFKERYKEINNGNIHVFFSKSKDNLDMAFKNGWYPLVISNRAIHKPYIDLLRFGYFLGYPNCCIDFFRRYNNHYLHNHLFETLKNTKSKPNIYCNPLLKDHTYSYIFHMPCSYDCKQTIEYVSELRKELLKKEPELVEITDRMLSKPFLVFKEQKVYIFEGEARQNCITYKNFAFLGNTASNEENSFSSILAKGDKVAVERGKIAVYSEKKRIYEEAKQPNQGFIIKFH